MNKLKPEMTIKSDTITAVSSAPGVGGVACIRVSGCMAYDICNNIFEAANGKSIVSQVHACLKFGNIVNKNSIVDEVLLVRFDEGKSYTGEQTVEIYCHGSLYIQQTIIKILTENGARIAQPGEFTQRAFMNGKMDLSQAEAVADLIASESASSHRLAINQMKGQISNELKELRNKLVDFVSLIELELDFSEEDVVFADRNKLKTLATHISSVISNLANTFEAGNAIKNGVPVAIVGETNAGKSTLLNLLLKEEKAIVSDIHGTTRDVIEDTAIINGITFRFIDTAGIRDTTDAIEKIGIERTFKKVHQAQIVIWLIDALSSEIDIKNLAEKLIPLCNNKQVIPVLNKTDLLDRPEVEVKQAIISSIIGINTLCISATLGKDVDSLTDNILKASKLPAFGSSDIVISNIRHYNALLNAKSAIDRAIEGLEYNMSGDLISQDIRECINYIGEITGEISTNDILSNIFSKFCIGK